MSRFERNKNDYLKYTISDNYVTASYVGFVISDELANQVQSRYIKNCDNNQSYIDNYEDAGPVPGTYYLKDKRTETIENR